MSLAICGAAMAGTPQPVFANLDRQEPPGRSAGAHANTRYARDGGRQDLHKKGSRDNNGHFISTPWDGRRICALYNDGVECDGRCGEVHICKKCTQGHPFSACPHKDRVAKALRDTGGGGKDGGKGGKGGKGGGKKKRRKGSN
jgi:hypothetical protein